MREALIKTHWTWLEPHSLVATKSRINVRCHCGNKTTIRVRDVLDEKTRWCRQCGDKHAASIRPLPQNLLTAAIKAAEKKLQKALPPNTPKSVYHAIYRRMLGAKNRCINLKNPIYKHYGARGIKFNFPDPRTATLWILHNLGTPPTEKHQIDRINNDGHYEPGNLRWASFSEQQQNKRPYKGNVYGHRLQKLLQQRPDYTYESLRKYILAGLSDEEILTRPKPLGGRPRKCQ